MRCLASYSGPFTCALRVSTWKKGLVSSICVHANYSNFLFFCIFSVYQWGVLCHEYRVELIYGLYNCCVTLAASIVSKSEYTFYEAVSFSLSQLELSGVSVEEEQLSAVKAVYEG